MFELPRQRSFVVLREIYLITHFLWTDTAELFFSPASRRPSKRLANMKM